MNLANDMHNTRTSTKWYDIATNKTENIHTLNLNILKYDITTQKYLIYYYYLKQFYCSEDQKDIIYGNIILL